MQAVRICQGCVGLHVRRWLNYSHTLFCSWRKEPAGGEGGAQARRLAAATVQGPGSGHCTVYKANKTNTPAAGGGWLGSVPKRVANAAPTPPRPLASLQLACALAHPGVPAARHVAARLRSSFLQITLWLQSTGSHLPKKNFPFPAVAAPHTDRWQRSETWTFLSRRSSAATHTSAPEPGAGSPIGTDPATSFSPFEKKRCLASCAPASGPCQVLLPPAPAPAPSERPHQFSRRA